MQVSLSPSVMDVLDSLIDDAKAGLAPTVYLKIDTARSYKGKNLIVEIDEVDAAELISKCEYEVGSNGGCRESMRMAWDPSERALWMGRERAFQALLKRLKAN